MSVTITSDATYFYVNTDILYIKIKKNTGSPVSFKLQAEMGIELAYQSGSPSYSLFYPEYGIINEATFGETAYGSVGRANTVTTQESDTQLKCVWNETPAKITWWFDFYSGKNYFSVRCLREIQQTKITVNAQQCYMFSDTFDQGGIVDYEGVMQKCWGGYPDESQSFDWIKLKRYPLFTYITDGSGDYFPFNYMEDTVNGVAVAVIITAASKEIFNSLNWQNPAFLTSTGEWEVQIGPHGCHDNNGIRLDNGLSYEYTSYIAALVGDRDNIKSLSQTLYTDLSGLTTHSKQDEYFDVCWSNRSNNFCLSAKNGYMQVKRYWKKTSATTGNRHRTIIPFPVSEMRINPVEWNFLKNGTTLVPFPNADIDDWGYTDGSDYQECYQTRTVGATTQTTTIRIYDYSKNTLRFICSADNITDVIATLLLGLWDINDYSASLIDTNHYRVSFTDAILGTLTFDVKAISNCSITYNDVTKVLTITPSSGSYEFHVIVELDALPSNKIFVTDKEDNIYRINPSDLSEEETINIS